MANPYGGSGSIVVVPSVSRVTRNRLGSRYNWRLSDTKHGKRVRVVVPKAKVARPILTDSEQQAILNRIAEAQARQRAEHTAQVGEHLRLVGAYN